MAEFLKENVSCNVVKAIKSMYTTVKLCVRYYKTFSQVFNSHIGLKQGDPSSPLLFMLHVNDMLQHINSHYENTPIQIYRKFYLQKQKTFR